jgi:hypothetical protein
VAPNEGQLPVRDEPKEDAAGLWEIGNLIREMEKLLEINCEKKLNGWENKFFLSSFHDSRCGNWLKKRGK